MKHQNFPTNEIGASAGVEGGARVNASLGLGYKRGEEVETKAEQGAAGIVRWLQEGLSMPVEDERDFLGACLSFQSSDEVAVITENFHRLQIAQFPTHSSVKKIRMICPGKIAAKTSFILKLKVRTHCDVFLHLLDSVCGVQQWQFAVTQILL